MESGIIMDRYHLAMAKFLSETREQNAVFSITQRKVPYAPVLGHLKLRQDLANTAKINLARVNFVKKEIGSAQLAEQLKDGFLGTVKLVSEGTIMFANEPFGYISGPFGNIQLREVLFEHAFDLPMTVGYRAMEMRRETDPDSFLSEFSLRRNEDVGKSIRVSESAYISGFDSTSNMEAAFRLGIPCTGTMAHYLVQSYISHCFFPKHRDESGSFKHFERIAFEEWLEANPNGTTLLIDTISYKIGIQNAVLAATSSPERKRAFKAIRIDSGDLIEASKYCRKFLDKNEFKNVGIILTGDLDAEKIKKIRKSLNFPILGYGIGTKLIAEVEKVSGVVFKLCEINGLPTLKLSGTPGKETLPYESQVWRCIDKDGYYVKDIVSNSGEPMPKGDDFVSAISLIGSFSENFIPKSSQELKKFVNGQLKKFTVPLEKYPVILSDELVKSKADIVKQITKIE